MNYFVKTPAWIKSFYPNRIWHMPGREKRIYLSFDDGPHPVLTPYVLDLLKKHEALASFFCVGSNVKAYPELFRRIIAEGHAVGNHTQDHLNGFRTADQLYLENVREAARYIPSSLFRPPYGRLRSSQARKLRDFRVIMWDILSGDFDETMTKERCLNGVLKKSKAGSIVVFHESDKAREKLEYVLPAVLDYFTKSGFRFSKLDFEEPGL